jgi:uncharacterized membrane protein
MNATPPETPAPVQPPIPPAAPHAGGTGEGRAVASNRGVAWWTEGWRLFTASPLIWIAIAVIYIVLMIALHWIPIVGQIAATVLTPVFAGSVLLGCRNLDRGGSLTVGDLFAAFNTKLGPLALLGVLYFAGSLVALLIAGLFGAAVFGFGGLSAAFSGDPMRMVGAFGVGALVVLLVLLLIAIPLAMAYWFSPALVALRDDEPVASLKASFAACARNLGPFLIYGLLFILFAIVASIPFGLGWIVLAPVFAASVYASYKDIFE